jgi:hypothetical protein
MGQARGVPDIVDPGPWIRQRVAEETKALREELATTRSFPARVRLRLRIWRISARIHRTFGRGGTVRW